MPKLIILDEADNMTSVAQFALRRVIEKYVSNARFCLICNYSSKIIPALQSRMTRFRFAPLSEEQSMSRTRVVAEAEGVRRLSAAQEPARPRRRSAIARRRSATARRRSATLPRHGRAQVKVADNGLEACVRLGHGDMRRALNLLQSTHMGFGVVTEHNVYKCAGQPMPQVRPSERSDPWWRACRCAGRRAGRCVRACGHLRACGQVRARR